MKWYVSIVLLGLIGGSGSLGSEETKENMLKTDWLYLPERALILDIRHSNMVTQCRQEAGELTQGIIRQLVTAGYTIYFSREYIQRELDYYEGLGEEALHRETSMKVGEVLRDALGQGSIDWGALRQIHFAAPDTASVSGNLPWLYLSKRTNQMAMTPTQPLALPQLEFSAVWEGRLMRGLSVGRERSIGGKAYLWKIDAMLRLSREGQTVAQKRYEAPAWQERYSGFGIFPLALQVQKIMKDLDRGLAHPPPPPKPDEPKKKKRKFLFF